MRIHIVGKGEGWELAPRPNEDTIVYGVNDLFYRRPVSVCFDMHDYNWTKRRHFKHQREMLVQYVGYPEVWLRWRNKLKSMERIAEFCNKTGTPLVSVDHYPWIPSSVKFPYDEAERRWHTDNFGCGVDYMIAYALLQDATELILWGINMSAVPEYQHQVKFVAFWCGVAAGEGVPVHVVGDLSVVHGSESGLIYGTDNKQVLHRSRYRDQYRLEPKVVNLEAYRNVTGKSEIIFDKWGFQAVSKEESDGITKRT